MQIINCTHDEESKFYTHDKGLKCHTNESKITHYKALCWLLHYRVYMVSYLVNMAD